NPTDLFNGTVHMTASDPNMALPATDVTMVNGVGTATVTPMTMGAQTITATDVADPTITASETVIGTAGAAVRFVETTIPAATASITVSPLHGVVAGAAQSFTVTVRDAFGNLASGYRGTLTFATSDTLAALPASYTFTAADAGTHTFSMTYKSSGGQTFTVT